MYDFYIMDLARINNEMIARKAKHAYYRLPVMEASLLERALTTVRAFINKPASQDGQVSEIVKTDN